MSERRGIRLSEGKCAWEVSKLHVESHPLMKRDFTIRNGKRELYKIHCGVRGCKSVVGIGARIRVGKVTAVWPEEVSGNGCVRERSGCLKVAIPLVAKAGFFVGRIFTFYKRVFCEEHRK